LLILLSIYRELKFPNEIVDNVRLLKNNEGDGYQLIVMDKLDNDPLYFDFKNQLVKKSIRPTVKWVGREELAEISNAFDITVSHHLIHKATRKIKSLAL